jgi:endogenous inhibitor of DNA gyrase (YacG/DUF329 family)
MKKTKQKYIACIWCGKDIKKPYAMYCSKKCSYEAKGFCMGG